MFTTSNSVNNSAIAAELNMLCGHLNAINDRYPRSCGTMIMVSDDTENQIEQLCHRITEAKDRLSALSDAEIGDFTDDVQGYREFLDRLTDIIAANMQEVARAREFLARYHSR